MTINHCAHPFQTRLWPSRSPIRLQRNHCRSSHATTEEGYRAQKGNTAPSGNMRTLATITNFAKTHLIAPTETAINSSYTRTTLTFESQFTQNHYITSHTNDEKGHPLRGVPCRIRRTRGERVSPVRLGPSTQRGVQSLSVGVAPVEPQVTVPRKPSSAVPEPPAPGTHTGVVSVL